VELFEYQAKKLLARYAVQAPYGQVAMSANEAEACARLLGCQKCVVKAQVAVGGRADRGGVAFARAPADVGRLASDMFEGGLASLADEQGTALPVRKVLIEEHMEPVSEIYAAVSLDRASGRLIAMTCPKGGRGLEDRARREPGLIARVALPNLPVQDRAVFAGLAAHALGEAPAARVLAGLLRDLTSAVVAFDATLIELNPLAVLRDGRLLALDARMTVDDNALFRRPALATLRDENERFSTDANVHEAQQHQINFVPLQGNIGVICNGAGLALATLDMVRDAGGRPAGFMDIRTTAKSLDIAHGVAMLLDNPAVSVILVNIHGGGMQRCDTVAEGLGMALRGRDPTKETKPLVIRMVGNNADFAQTVLRNSAIPYRRAATMCEAVTQAVAATGKQAA